MAPTPEIEMDTITPETPTPSGYSGTNANHDSDGNDNIHVAIGKTKRSLPMAFGVTHAQAAKKNKDNSIHVPFNFDISPLPLSRTFQNAQDKGPTGEELVEQARQLLIQALPKFQNDKQSSAQDLLAQVQAFQQGSPTATATATAKIERQIQVLQQTVDRMSKTHTANPSSQPSCGSQETVRSQTDTRSPPSSYASALQSSSIPVGESAISNEQTSQSKEWTTIRRNKQMQAQEKRNRPCQLVFELQDKTTLIDPAPLRNKINKAFQDTGFRDGALVLSARKSTKDNLVLTCTNSTAKEYILNHSRTLLDTIREARVIEDSTWFKVVAHGVPQAYFSLNNPQEVAKEVEEFNKGLTPIGTPVWLTGQQH